MTGIETGKPLVLEQQVRQTLMGHSLIGMPAAHLMQERRLARAADSGDRRRLAGEGDPAEHRAEECAQAGSTQRVRQLFGQNATQPYGIHPFSPYFKEVIVYIPP